MFENSNPEPPPGLDEIRALRPAAPVWVDLGAAFPLGPPRGTYPYGLDLQAIVPGDLKIWHRTTTGYWVGWVLCTIGGSRVGQWVMGSALEPRHEGATRIVSARRLK